MESTGLALPPTIFILSPSTSRDWTLWKKAVFFPSLWLLVGWIMFLQLAYCMNVIQHCHFHFHVSSMSAPTAIPHMPCRLCIFNVFFFFFSTVLPPATPLPPSLPHSTKASVEVLSSLCREIQTDRRVKRVSCRAAAAAAEALLLRGCDLDNQEELERLQALEPLQLQQCQEGVSCVTQCPI